MAVGPLAQASTVYIPIKIKGHPPPELGLKMLKAEPENALLISIAPATLMSRNRPAHMTPQAIE